MYWNCGRSVGIATRLQAGRFALRIATAAIEFSPPTRPDGSGVNLASYAVGTGGGLKRPGHDDHTIPPLRLHGIDRGTFTF